MESNQEQPTPQPELAKHFPERALEASADYHATMMDHINSM